MIEDKGVMVIRGVRVTDDDFCLGKANMSISTGRGLSHDIQDAIMVMQVKGNRR